MKELEKSLKPFDEYPTCVKCLNNDTVLEYYDRVVEYLITTCKTCGFEWIMAVNKKKKSHNEKKIEEFEVVIKKEELEGWRSNLEKRMDKLEKPGK